MNLAAVPIAMYSRILICLLAAGLAACRTEPAAAPPAASAAPALLVPDEQLGALFDTVQRARIFPDSKTFPDCRPLLPPGEILARYGAESRQPGFRLDSFVMRHFEPPRSFASGFAADASRPVEDHIQALWPVLTRRPDSGHQLSSLIPLPYPYIVPGGRFGEVYYWDSYFTMLGLQVSPGGPRIIRNMVDNFAYLLDTLGHIPNGNRSYYLGRSQPPFFAMMVRLLADSEGISALTRYLPAMEREYAFWMDGSSTLSESRRAHRRAVRMPDGSVLNRYWDDQPRPRPESYREDVELARSAPQPPDSLYRNLRAACESGWDFSSRWLADPANLGSIRTTELAPVDLNCLLLVLEETIAEAAGLAGDTRKQAQYTGAAQSRKRAILLYCWDPARKRFADSEWRSGAPSPRLSLAAVFPLWMRLADPAQARAVAQVVQDSLLAPGGALTTPLSTGQQWDAPNGWAPLQWAAIEGLRAYGLDALAGNLSRRWIVQNTRVYRATGKLVEKYNVVDQSLTAGGGEYPLQDGFGWTNGVLLRLLHSQESR
ncbi:MAG: alpha,alpha-trehalase TreF [Bacteroidia bacterium]|nr:alpha,alpha-trehalase TreF [Bacteroidia bacterium]